MYNSTGPLQFPFACSILGAISGFIVGMIIGINYMGVSIISGIIAGSSIGCLVCISQVINECRNTSKEKTLSVIKPEIIYSNPSNIHSNYIVSGYPKR
jgi:hypothetical protein